MYNCNHELQLKRQTGEYAIFNSVFLATKGRVHLSRMLWCMPKITLTKNYTATLYQHISSGVECDLAFMNKINLID